MILTRYVAAAVCARLADEGARVAILLLALDRTGDPAQGGLMIAALMVPHVLAGPVVGAVADAARRRRAVYCTAFLVYAAALIAAAAFVGRAPVPTFALLVVAGCVAPLLMGGLTSLLGELAGDRLERAFGLDAMTYSLGGIAGPALAAVVAGIGGAFLSVAALAVLVLAGAVLVTTLPLAARPAGERRRMGSPFAAVAVMWRRPRLGAVTVSSMVAQVGTGALPVVAALLAAQAHRPGLTGLTLSAGAAGGLTGSLVCTRWPVRRRPPEWVVAVCTAGAAVPFVVLTLLPAGATVWAGLPMFAVAGGLGAFTIVAVFAVRDQESPPGVRTQVFTLGAGLKITSAALGAAVAGLAAPVGVRVLLAGIAACQLLGAIVVWVVGRFAAPASPARPEQHRDDDVAQPTRH